ncbi:MAG: DUF362 domain-containing protein [Candidatus Kariarchaeaceae archaeon]
MPIVSISPITNNDIQQALDNSISEIGGLEQFIEGKEKIIIKVNGVHFSSHSYTSPEFIDAFLVTLINIGVDPKKIYIIESCTQGAFTRIVFKVTKIIDIIKKHKINVIYLDEEPSVPYVFGEKGPEQYEQGFPRFVFDELITNREKNAFFNLPRLKCHWWDYMTGTLKNQLGLLHDKFKKERHHDKHFQRIVDINVAVSPDAHFIDGITAVARGPTPPEIYIERDVHPANIVIAGIDPVAVDTVASRILGYDPIEDEIIHINLANKVGLGEMVFDNINVKGNWNLFGSWENRKEWQLPYKGADIFPPKTHWVEGTERDCWPGCLGLSRVALETIYSDHQDKNPEFTIVQGKGLTEEDVSGMKGAIVLFGSCAINDVGDFIHKNYRKVYQIDLGGDLGGIIDVFRRVLGLSTLEMVPMNPVKAFILLMKAKLHGLDASHPPIFGD